MLALAISFFMYEFALRTVLGTFTHQIIPALHLTPWSYSIIDSAYSLSFVLFAIPVGVLADRFGIRWAMIVAMLVLALATWFYAGATGFYAGLLSRLLMGAGSALSFVSVVIIIMMWFPKKYFAFLVGASQLIATMGPMLGGGPLIRYISQTHETWRMGLRDISYLGFALCFLMLIFVREKKRSKDMEKLFIQGVGQVLRYLALLFKSKQAWATVLFTAMCYSGFQLLCTVWGVEYLQARGISQQLAANAITFGWIGYALGCPLLGFLSDRQHNRPRYMMLAAILGVTTSILLVYSPTWSSSYYAFVFFCLGVAASGSSLSFVLLAERVSPMVKASATAFNNSMISIYVALLTLLSSALINHATQGTLAHVHARDFVGAFTVLPLSFLLAFVLGWYLLISSRTLHNVIPENA